VSRIGFVAVLLLIPLAAGALDDPMRPPMTSAASPRRAVAVETGLVLSATTIARDRRVAIINGMRVSEGEHIGAAQVVEILPTLVRLKQGEKEVVLRLVPVSVKTPTNNKEQQ
jgi:hypothetical protein